MARSEAALAARVRRAYELGRLAAGLRGAWPLVLLVPVSVATHGAERLPLTLAAAAGALLAAVLFGWRGGAFARGASAGWLAGLPPLFLPVIVMARLSPCAECDLMGMGHAGARWPECLLACGVGGLVAGVFVGLRAARDPRAPLRYALAAAAVAWLTGLLGCSLVGVSGALGTVAGLVLGATPVLLGARAARAS